MTLESRIAKLERTDPAGENFPQVAIVSFVGHDLIPDPGFAIFPGSDLPQINRKDGETAEEFIRRAYATKTGGKSVDDMNDDEREKAYAAYDALRVRTGEQTH